MVNPGVVMGDLFWRGSTAAGVGVSQVKEAVLGAACAKPRVPAPRVRQKGTEGWGAHPPVSPAFSCIVLPRGPQSMACAADGCRRRIIMIILEVNSKFWTNSCCFLVNGDPVEAPSSCASSHHRFGDAEDPARSPLITGDAWFARRTRSSRRFVGIVNPRLVPNCVAYLLRARQFPERACCLSVSPCALPKPLRGFSGTPRLASCLCLAGCLSGLPTVPTYVARRPGVGKACRVLRRPLIAIESL